MALPQVSEAGSPGVAEDRPQLPTITPEWDRHNGRVFLFSCLLAFLAAPVLYVGVVQAALCSRLGASATVANIPASAYAMAFFFPIIIASIVPIRLERTAVIVASSVTTIVTAITCVALIVPFSNSVRLGVVIGSGSLTGVSESIASVYKYQCLARGTTDEWRARTLRITYTLGPVFAVLGSVGAQHLLNGSIRALSYPRDFGFIYLASAVCMVGVTLLSRGYKLPEVQEQSHPSFYNSLRDGMKSYAANRNLVLLWFSYLLFNFSFNSICNLALYVRDVVGGPPQALPGMIMALRFAFKAMGGFALGAIAIRRGFRAPLIVATFLIAVAIVWGWFIPGYLSLVAFGLLGAGELGGVYYSNYAVSVSTPERGARNLALLNLAVAISGVAPITYGAIADKSGYPASFVLGIVTGLLALWLSAQLSTEEAKKPCLPSEKIVVRRVLVHEVGRHASRSGEAAPTASPA